MKVYISGQISGLELSDARKKFNEKSMIVHEFGDDPVNPFDIVHYDPTFEWIDYMEPCIKALMKCDAITMIDGWGNSKGARIEKAIAEGLGLIFLSYETML